MNIAIQGSVSACIMTKRKEKNRGVVFLMTYAFFHNLRQASLLIPSFCVSGFVMNLQPSETEAGFDIRVPPTADPEPLERWIAEEWAPASRNMTFEVFTFWKFLSLEPFLHTKKRKRAFLGNYWQALIICL